MIDSSRGMYLKAILTTVSLLGSKRMLRVYVHIMIITTFKWTRGFYKSERLGGGTADLINGLSKSIIVANDGRFHGSLAMKHMHKHDIYSRRKKRGFQTREINS